jgi:hypothetical protein
LDLAHRKPTAASNSQQNNSGDVGVESSQPQKESK